ncbi:MAG: hypothetical protein U1E65_00845 [Myxococcota bacterium]
MRLGILVPLFLLSACGGGDGTHPDASVSLDAASAADSGVAGCAIRCSSLDLAATHYDASSHLLALEIAANAPGARSGSLTVMLGLHPAGGNPSTTSKSAVLMVNGHSATIDLSPWITADLVTFGPMSVTLVGDCGMTSTFGLGVLTQGSGTQLSLTSFQCL